MYRKAHYLSTKVSSKYIPDHVNRQTSLLYLRSYRGVRNVHSLGSLWRHQSNCEGTEKKIRAPKKIGTPKKKLKRIGHYPMGKMKSNCDEETANPLTYLL